MAWDTSDIIAMASFLIMCIPGVCFIIKIIRQHRQQRERESDNFVHPEARARQAVDRIQTLPFPAPGHLRSARQTESHEFSLESRSHSGM